MYFEIILPLKNNDNLHTTNTAQCTHKDAAAVQLTDICCRPSGQHWLNSSVGLKG